MGWVGSLYFSEGPPDDPDRETGRWYTPWSKLTKTPYEQMFVYQFRGVHKLGRPVPAEWIYRDADHSKCPISIGEHFDWCLRHWIALEHKRLELMPAPNTVPCPHCTELFSSKGEQKKHMQKRHKDLLAAARKAYLDAHKN